MVSGSKIGHVMTLANSIIGVGILAMPFCFQKCGIILSILLLIISHFITRICCHYLIKSSVLCRRRTFEYLGSYAFGSSGKLMVELCVIGYLMGTCITYFVVVGDLGPQITAKIFNVNQTDTLRTWIMILVTILAIIPLGLLKNVDSLAVVCTASIGFYMCLVVKIIEASGDHLSKGDWYENVEYWRPSGILQCLPIFSMALSCQMQLFEVYETIPNVTLEKMNEIVKLSTVICTLVYIMVGFFGYIAFSSQPFSGNILVFLAPSITSDIIKIGFVLSVAFSFPLVIFPCRASLYSLLYRRGYTDGAHYIPEIRFKLITIGIVAFTLFIGILIPSVELVIGLVGSTIGVAICIMFPAAVFNKVSKKDSTEKLLSQTLLVFGFTLMILGTYANLSAIDEKKSSTNILAENLRLDEIPLIIKNKEEDEDKLPKLELPLNGIIPTDNDQSGGVKQLQLNLSKIDLSSSIDKNEIPLKPIVKDENIIPNKYETIVKEINLLPLSNDKSQDDQNKKETSIVVDANKSIEMANVDLKINIPIVNKLKTEDNNNNNNNNENKVKNSLDVIDKEAIQKEEQEIAIEEKNDLKDKEKDDVRLKKTKEFIAEHIEDIKQEIEKQNKETQQLVLQRFEEIAEKVDKIERAQEEQQQEDDENKNQNLPKQSNNNNVNKLAETNELTNNLNEIKQELKDTVKKTNADIIVNNEKDPIVKLLIDNSKLNNTKYETNHNDEPLSYQIGEQLNSVIKEKSQINVNNKLPHENTNEKLYDSKSINAVEKLPDIEEKLVKNSIDESLINIEAVGRDILEIKNNDLNSLTQEKIQSQQIPNDDSIQVGIIDNNNNNNNNRRDKRNIDNCNNNENDNANNENIKNNFYEGNPIEKLNDVILPNIKFESTLIGRSLKYLNQNNNNNEEKKV